MNSAWVDFYRGVEPDSEGRYIGEILAWDDDRLEDVHDYIQWLFPLPEPSLFNPDAPLLTRADVAAARGDATVRENLRAAYARMRRFYGLTPETEARPKPWVCAADHNHLRLTRILKSLNLLGLRDEARSLYEAISAFDGVIPARTRLFWREAVNTGSGTS
jgi:Opioid growth factor receptor (OGFr) conserved region